MVQEQPIHIFMVDLTGSHEYLDLVKAGLLASIEAMPPTCHIGELTYAFSVALSLSLDWFDVALVQV